MAGRLAGGISSFLMLAAMIRLFLLWRRTLTKSGFHGPTPLPISNRARHFLKTMREQNATQGKREEGKEARKQGGVRGRQDFQLSAALTKASNLIVQQSIKPQVAQENGNNHQEGLTTRLSSL